jgi:hypothetical protein
LKKKIETERQKANEDLKKELSRQAAAHNNHLTQMLRIQHDELQSIFEKYVFDVYNIYILMNLYLII